MPIDYSKESDTEQDYVNIHADRVNKYSFPRSFSGIPKRAESDLKNEVFPIQRRRILT